MIKPEQIPKEVQRVVHEMRMNGMRAKEIAAAVVNAWPGMAVYDHRHDADEEPHVYLPLAEKSSHE